VATPYSEKNAYFNDPESAIEMARILDQSHLMTKGTGGLFAERSNDFSGIHRVLDLACGPGGWVREVALTYPGIEVVGVDISQTMTDYANTQAQKQHLNNAHFKKMDITQPLHFPDGSFDMVNARFIGYLSPEGWSQLMQECKRVTQPGSIIRLTEQEWWCFTTSAALEQLNEMICRLIKLQGSFSPTGRFLGILPMLGWLLHVIDSSAGTEAHDGFCKDTQVIFKLCQPAIVKAGIVTQEEVDQLYEQMKFDMLQEGFRGILLILTAWGERMYSQE